MLRSGRGGGLQGGCGGARRIPQLRRAAERQAQVRRPPRSSRQPRQLSHFSPPLGFSANPLRNRLLRQLSVKRQVLSGEAEPPPRCSSPLTPEPPAGPAAPGRGLTGAPPPRPAYERRARAAPSTAQTLRLRAGPPPTAPSSGTEVAPSLALLELQMALRGNPHPECLKNLALSVCPLLLPPLVTGGTCGVGRCRHLTAQRAQGMDISVGSAHPNGLNLSAQTGVTAS